MANGAVRSDFTTANFVPGEDAYAEWRYRDSTDTDITDVTNREFTFYLKTNEQQTKEQAQLTVAWAAGVSAPEPPFIRLALSATAGQPESPDYKYELWRTDSGSERPIAYGDFPLGLSWKRVSER